jgi:hypothetical protein
LLNAIPFEPSAQANLSLSQCLCCGQLSTRGGVIAPPLRVVNPSEHFVFPTHNDRPYPRSFGPARCVILAGVVVPQGRFSTHRGRRHGTLDDVSVSVDLWLGGEGGWITLRFPRLTVNEATDVVTQLIQRHKVISGKPEGIHGPTQRRIINCGLVRTAHIWEGTRSGHWWLDFEGSREDIEARLLDA